MAVSRGCEKCGGRKYRLERRGDLALAKVCECSWPCPDCSGAGMVLVKEKREFSSRVGEREYEIMRPCPCRLLTGRVEQFGRARVPGVLAHATFENYRPFNAGQDAAKKAALAFLTAFSKKEPNRGLVVSGPVGTGKTHLMVACLSHLVLELGVRAEYVEISLLYSTIRRGFKEGKSGGEIIGPLSEVEVLAIDELGKGRGSQFELETLDELIARRYNAGRTTLFATNYSLEAPSARKPSGSGYKSTEELRDSGAKDSELLHERVGARIYSRLCEMCEFVELPSDTPDHRRAQQGLIAGRARR